MPQLEPPPTPLPTPSPYRWMIRVMAVIIAVLFVSRISNYRLTANASASQVSPLRVIRVIPPFTLTERSGKIITNQDLAGKIWVADFIYTTCPGPCPMVTHALADLQKQVADDPRVQLVSITVDPKHDTPDVLTAYANHFGADPNKWWFLTGEQKSTYELVENGFLQSVQDNQNSADTAQGFLITHSLSFVLVDANGNMRGAYQSTDPDERQQLLKDIKRLEKETPP